MDIQYLYILEWGLRIAVGPVIVLRRHSPSTALAWLVVVLFMPMLGSAVYFLVGENRLGRKGFKTHKAVVQKLSAMLGRTFSATEIANSDLPAEYQLTSSLAYGLRASPTLGGNELALITGVEDLVTQLVSDIDHAHDHCHLLYYIFNDDSVGRRVAEALVRASARGVKCRLLVDGVGSRQLTRGPLWTLLRDSGVELRVALPVSFLRLLVARLDLRNHRKLAVLDGLVAYTGSHNISEALYPKKERFGAWVDSSVRMRGPAVHVLQELFIQDWYASDGTELALDRLFPSTDPPPDAHTRVQILPTGPADDDAPIEKVILQAAHLARKRIVLTTPYFVPDDALVDALRTAALRGVKVVLVVPKRSDSPVAQAAGRSRYGDLLSWGIEIHEYTQGLLHAKTITVDQQFAVIGSANLDIRSFMLNFELALLVYDEDFAARLHFLQMEYLNASEPVTLTAWRKRGLWRVLIDNTSKLMSPLL